MSGAAVPFGLVVRIPGFHPGGPGSIPGVGSNFFFYYNSTIYFLFFFFSCVENFFFYRKENWSWRTLGWQEHLEFLSDASQQKYVQHISACAHHNVHLVSILHHCDFKFSLSEYAMCTISTPCGSMDALCRWWMSYSGPFTFLTASFIDDIHLIIGHSGHTPWWDRKCIWNRQVCSRNHSLVAILVNSC